MRKEHSFLAVSAIWYERFLECSRTCMTSEFTNSVWRFYRSLLNLDSENERFAIKDKVRDYVEEVWQPNVNRIVERNTRYTNDEDVIRLESQLVEAQHIYEVFEFIIQAIQDSGIGWQVMNFGNAEAWDYDDAIKKD